MTYSYAKTITSFLSLDENGSIRMLRRTWFLLHSRISCVPRYKRRNEKNSIMLPIVSLWSSADTLPQRNSTKEGTHWEKKTDATTKVIERKIQNIPPKQSQKILCKLRPTSPQAVFYCFTFALFVLYFSLFHCL